MHLLWRAAEVDKAANFLISIFRTAAPNFADIFYNRTTKVGPNST